MVAADDGSIAGLLGASPGASTAVSEMLGVLQRCFADRYQAWLPTLKDMVPSLGATLSNEPALAEELRSWSSQGAGTRPELPVSFAVRFAACIVGGGGGAVTVALRRAWAKTSTYQLFTRY